MTDLTSARQKAKRAKHHIGNLDIAIPAFLGKNPYLATPEFYPQHNSTVYFLDKFEIVPEDIPLIVGDAIHNLRTALDHIAYALVSKGVGAGERRSSRRHTYFPISETAERYEAEAPGKIEGMLRSDKEAIAAIKPYGGGTDLLWGIHSLDVTDKHRLLITATACAGTFGIEITQEEVESALHNIITMPKGTIETKRFWFPAPENRLLALKSGDPVLCLGGNFEMKDKVQLTFDVAFGEPEVFKGKSVLKTLHEAADLIDGIIMSFA